VSPIINLRRIGQVEGQTLRYLAGRRYTVCDRFFPDGALLPELESTVYLARKRGWRGHSNTGLRYLFLQRPHEKNDTHRRGLRAALLIGELLWKCYPAVK
jgi:hypothetical protein